MFTLSQGTLQIANHIIHLELAQTIEDGKKDLLIQKYPHHIGYITKQIDEVELWHMIATRTLLPVAYLGLFFEVTPVAPYVVFSNADYLNGHFYLLRDLSNAVNVHVESIFTNMPDKKPDDPKPSARKVDPKAREA